MKKTLVLIKNLIGILIVLTIYRCIPDLQGTSDHILDQRIVGDFLGSQTVTSKNEEWRVLPAGLSAQAIL